jgi:valyl-tRNA synthetase
MADASNGFHAFWIHDFCDQYIESSKFIFYGEDESLKKETATVLFHVIETGMRLLHPMMPFLTEELYQKLPDFDGKFESLCIGEYPAYKSNWDQS